MKKINFLMAIIIALFITSCTDDDDDPKINNQGIVGTWTLTSGTCVNGETITEVNGFETTSQFDWEFTDIDLTVTFTENPNQYTSTGSYTESVNMYMEGVLISHQDIPFDNVNVEGTWETNGSVISINAEGTTAEMDIIELTSNSLKLRGQLNNVESVGGGTIITAGTITYEYVIAQ